MISNRMNNSWVIYGGRVVDPARGVDTVEHLHILNGRIADTSTHMPAGTPVVDATGLVVCPGLWDIHVHFREPGKEVAETFASGSRAALRGGFTTVVTMPNTNPPVDTADRVKEAVQRAGACAQRIQVLPSACISRGRRGKTLTDLAALTKAGAVAFTDDGSNVSDEALLREALQAAAAQDVTIMDHALDPHLAGNGVMHQGRKSAQLGFPGIPSDAELVAVERDIRLSEETGCAVHIQHVSTAGAVAMIRDAQERDVRVSGEVTPHHLALTEDDIPCDDANYKMSPPLRTTTDRHTLIEGIMDGTLQALATDHAPHLADEKRRGFCGSPFGVVGLETAVGVTYTVLVEQMRMPLSAWVERWTSGPASVLGLPAPSLQPGRPANVTILNVDTRWTVDPAAFLSLSRNTPFRDRRFTARPVRTFYEGIDSLGEL
jgi:dihydroorotase